MHYEAVRFIGIISAFGFLCVCLCVCVWFLCLCSSRLLAQLVGELECGGGYDDEGDDDDGDHDG